MGLEDPTFSMVKDTEIFQVLAHLWPRHLKSNATLQTYPSLLYTMWSIATTIDSQVRT